MGFLSFSMPEDRFKSVVSFEDDLYTGISRDSSEFPTEARNKRNRDEDIFLDFYAGIWNYDGSQWCSFIIQSGSYLKNNSI